jgi:hypothetical protein
MATQTLLGTLTYLTIGQTSAVIEISDANGVREKFQLWADVYAGIPHRVTQRMWVSLCREALTNGTELLIVPESANSAQVATIRMNRPSGV